MQADNLPRTSEPSTPVRPEAGLSASLRRLWVQREAAVPVSVWPEGGVSASFRNWLIPP